MKIAFLSMYSGLVDRGVETLTHELAKRLADSGNQVVVFQGGPSLKTNYEIEKVDLNVDWSKKGASGPSGVFNYWNRLILRFTLGTFPTLWKEKFDIIVPLNNSWQRLLVKIICLLRGSKMIISAQAGPGLEDRLNLYFFPDAFVAFTEYQCNWARKINPLVKVVKIPNGVDLSVFKTQGEKLATKLKKPIVLSVAAFIKIKRLDLAIKAVAMLPGVSLMLIGDGEEKERLQALGDKLLPGRFSIAKVPFKEISKVYRSADIFTFPTSSWESFGIVILEAMATNLPVVASDDPIRREIVGDAGILVNPEDTDSYAKAIETALKRNWGNIPREQAEKFSWDEIAGQYEALFKELVK
ncbi:MAG: glycosyltransferase family 4 protein [bacterium]|nr:glycosyltransferase family 4 protein [bacterium]